MIRTNLIWINFGRWDRAKFAQSKEGFYVASRIFLRNKYWTPLIRIWYKKYHNGV